MADYIKSDFIIEDRVKLQDIPTIIFRPRNVERNIPTIIFYHGWSSNKELQRLRGFVLAAAGYQVIIPDAVYHGERNHLRDYGMEAAREYFWDVIFSNMEEFNVIMTESVSKYGADPKRIAVTGNSMGGFTAGGIFTHNEDVKTIVVLNGTCAWESFNGDVWEPEDDILRKKFKVIEKRVKDLDPINHLDKLKNRPILMLHGESDNMVPIEGQIKFYEKLKPLYDSNEKIKLVEYANLNHFVITNMMEESINWFGKYL